MNEPSALRAQKQDHKEEAHDMKIIELGAGLDVKTLRMHADLMNNCEQHFLLGVVLPNILTMVSTLDQSSNEKDLRACIAERLEVEKRGFTMPELYCDCKLMSK